MPSNFLPNRSPGNPQVLPALFEIGQPGFAKDYADMSSSEFKNMVATSSDPAAFLAQLGEEAQGRFYQTAQIVDVLVGTGDTQALYDTVTEQLHAPQRAASRKAQKEALADSQIPKIEIERRTQAQQQIDREYDQESSFGRFFTTSSGSSIAMLYEESDTVLEGTSRYFSGIGRISDRDAFEAEKSRLDRSLEAYYKSSSKKQPRHLEEATIYAYNAFYRLHILDQAISGNPSLAQFVRQLTGAMKDFRMVLESDATRLDQISTELRDIIQGRIQDQNPTLALPSEHIDELEVLLSRLRRRDL